MGNGKSEIPETLEPWNTGTLRLWNLTNLPPLSLIPYGEFIGF